MAVRDNLLGGNSNKSSMNINGEIKEYNVQTGNDISSGDFVQMENIEVQKTTKEVEKEKIEVVTEEVPYAYNVVKPSTILDKPLQLNSTPCMEHPITIKNRTFYSDGTVKYDEKRDEIISFKAYDTDLPSLNNNRTTEFGNNCLIQNVSAVSESDSSTNTSLLCIYKLYEDYIKEIQYNLSKSYKYNGYLTKFNDRVVSISCSRYMVPSYNANTSSFLNFNTIDTDALFDTENKNGSITITCISDADNNKPSEKFINLTENYILSNVTAGTIINCPYIGKTKQVTLPAGKYKLECIGAKGGNSYNDSGRNLLATGGSGGYSKGILTLTKDTDIYISVGGYGNSANISGSSGGFNGGGSAMGDRNYWYSYNPETGKNDILSGIEDTYNGCGGGASDIRIGSDSLYARVIVAGGGGGAYGENWRSAARGGNGGGTTSETLGSDPKNIGATQTSGGITMADSKVVDRSPFSSSFGNATRTVYHSGQYSGGGAGWYSGMASYGTVGATGGSSYVYTAETAGNYPSGCLLNESYYLEDAYTVSVGEVNIKNNTISLSSINYYDRLIQINYNQLLAYATNQSTAQIITVSDDYVSVTQKSISLPFTNIFPIIKFKDNVLIFCNTDSICFGIIKDDNIEYSNILSLNNIDIIDHISPITLINDKKMLIAGYSKIGIINIDDDYNITLSNIKNVSPSQNYITSSSNNTCESGKCNLQISKLNDNKFIVANNYSILNLKSKNNKNFDSGFNIRLDSNDGLLLSDLYNVKNLDVLEVDKNTVLIAYYSINTSNKGTFVKICNINGIEITETSMFTISNYTSGNDNNIKLTRLNNGNIICSHSNNKQSILTMSGNNLIVSDKTAINTSTISNLYVKEVTPNKLLYIYCNSSSQTLARFGEIKDNLLSYLSNEILLFNNGKYKKIIELEDNKLFLDNYSTGQSIIIDIDIVNYNINILSSLDFSTNTVLEYNDYSKAEKILFYQLVDSIKANDKILQIFKVRSKVSSSNTVYQALVRLLSIDDNYNISVYKEYNGKNPITTNPAEYLYNDSFDSNFYYLQEISSDINIIKVYNSGTTGTSSKYRVYFDLFKLDILENQLNFINIKNIDRNIINWYGSINTITSAFIDTYCKLFNLSDNRLLTITINFKTNYNMRLFDLNEPVDELVKETYENKISYKANVDNGITSPSDKYSVFNFAKCNGVTSIKLDMNKILIAYNDENSSYMISGTVYNDGTIDYGQYIKFRDTPYHNINLVALSETKALAVYTIHDTTTDTYSSKYLVVGIDGTIISPATEADLGISTNKIKVLRLTSNKVIIYTPTGTMKLCTVSTNSGVITSDYNLDFVTSGPNSNIDNLFITILKDNSVFLVYRDNALSKITGIVGTISGNSIIYSLPSVYSKYNIDYLGVCKVNNGKVFITYSDVSDGYKGYYVTAGIDDENNVIFSDDSIVFNESDTHHINADLIDTNRLVLFFSDDDNTSLYSTVADLSRNIVGDKYLYTDIVDTDTDNIAANILDNNHVFVAFAESVDERFLGNSCLLYIDFEGLSICVTNQLTTFTIDDTITEITVNKEKLNLNGFLIGYTEKEESHYIIPSSNYTNINIDKANYLNTVYVSENQVLNVYGDGSDNNRGKISLTTINEDGTYTTSDKVILDEDYEVSAISATTVAPNKVLVIYRTIANTSAVGNAIIVSIDDSGNIYKSDIYNFTNNYNKLSNVYGGFDIITVQDNKALIVYTDTEQQYMTAIVASVQGDNSILFGTPYNFGNMGSYMKLCKMTPNKILLAFNDNALIGSQLVVLSVSGDQVIAGRSNRFTTHATSYKSIDRITNNKALVTYVDNSDNNIAKSFIVKISGTNTVINNEVSITNGDTSYIKTLHLFNNGILYVYRNSYNKAVARLAILKGINMNIYSPSIINKSEGNESCNTDINLIKLGEHKAVISLNENIGGSDLATLFTINVNYTAITDITFDGVAKTSGTDGDKIKVCIPTTN